eukprot:m.186260 g.186260  ORF g.186260 m.186260 type:complete len:848 (+) comp17508_c0_seq1:163-2706(+)
MRGYLTMTTLLLLLFAASAVALSTDVPPEWADDVARMDKIVGSDTDANPQWLDAVGNGFVATQLMSDAMFVAGLYNGIATSEAPSHRARIESTVNVNVTGARCSNSNGDEPLQIAPGPCALDVRRAVHYRRTLLLTNSGAELAVIEQRWFAHQTLGNTLVMELQVLWPELSTRSSDPQCDSITVALQSNPGEASRDIVWKTAKRAAAPQSGSLNGGADVSLRFGSTREAETSDTPRISVAVYYDVVPESVTFSYSSNTNSNNSTNKNAAQSAGVDDTPKNTTLTFLTSVATSIETAVEKVTSAAQTAYADAAGVAASGPTALLDLHAKAWNHIWLNGGIEVGGSRRDVAIAANTSLYYLFSSIRPDRNFSLSPGGLASNSYNGHVFWDAETWMYPAFLLLQTETAAGMLQYRFDRLAEAREKAQSYVGMNYSGAMFPWESAFTGVETCPTTAGTGLREVHISGDIAFAIMQYWFTSKNMDWLKAVGYPMLKEIAVFWVSRSTANSPSSAPGSPVSINDVIGPDEYADHVNDSVYTNAVAKMSLASAAIAAQLLGDFSAPTDVWLDVAQRLVIPFDATQQIHPEYDGYPGNTVKQADAILLGFPLGFNASTFNALASDMLDHIRSHNNKKQTRPLKHQQLKEHQQYVEEVFSKFAAGISAPHRVFGSDSVWANDIAYYAKRTDAEGPAMTWGMFCIGYLATGDVETAAVYFNRSFANAKPPYGVWTETPEGGAVNFLTGIGGFTQVLLFGYTGLRITGSGRMQFNPPALIEGTTSLTLRGVDLCGGSFHITYDAANVSVASGSNDHSNHKVAAADPSFSFYISDKTGQQWHFPATLPLSDAPFQIYCS